MNMLYTEQTASRQIINPIAFSDSPTPMIDGVFIPMRNDFYLLTGSVHAANVLRGLETLYIEHLKMLRRCGLAANAQPDAMDAWFTLPTLRDFSQIWVRKTASHTQSGKDYYHLAALGYIELRYVAYVDERWQTPLAKIFTDPTGGRYIILKDAEGHYETLVGTTGKLPKDRVVRQCRYCDDAINEAIYLLAGLEPPPSPERARALTRAWPESPPEQKDAPPAGGVAAPVVASDAGEESMPRNSQTTAAKLTVVSQNDTLVNDSSISLRSTATINVNGSGNVVQSTHKAADTTEPKLHRDTVNRETLALAPLTPATYIDVLSLILPIPARKTVSAKWWHLMVEEPCQWMYDHREPGLAPRYAMENVIKRAMWTQHDDFWKGKRTLPSNLVGRDKIDGKPVGALNGNNWDRMPGDWKKAGGYHPVIDIEYYGPEPAYQGGYTAQDAPEARQVEQETVSPVEIEASSQAEDAPSESCQERDTDEIPVVSPPMALRAQGWTMPREKRLEGMDDDAARKLKERIEDDCHKKGETIPDLQYLPLDDGSHHLAMMLSEDEWHVIRSWWDWFRMPALHPFDLKRAQEYAGLIGGFDQQEAPAEEEGRALVSHPEYRFLFLDDTLAPTILYLQITGESELEDDRRRRIAQEVKRDLAERGYRVVIQCIREAVAEAVEA